jgi:acyl-coenzyme A thioesterase PaaI-like protein
MSHLSQKLFDKLPISMIKFILNLWPPFWGAGIHVNKIKLHWYNRNYMGVHFGGSLYSMTDPFPMLMTMRNLGKNYIVWDKAARIDYVRPGSGTVYADFEMTAEQINTIRTEANNNEKYLFDYPITVTDDAGKTVATIIKTIYVKRLSPSLLP